MTLDTDKTTYEAFRAEWVSEINQQPNSVAKGRAFAIKLAREWLDVDPNEDDFFYSDGPGDGGIDMAYLHSSSDYHTLNDSPSEEDSDELGDTWYLFQSKFGTAIRGSDTITKEADKVFGTLSNDTRAHSGGSSVAERVRNFARQDSDGRDKLVLVIATLDPLSQEQVQQLDEVRSRGAELMPPNGPTFDVESASVRSIYDRANAPESDTALVIRGRFSELGDDAKVGTITLFELYEFLKSYRSETGELDRLYEKNVRRWLGMGKTRKVNFGIKDTLETQPERFGLYNNGITFVASRFSSLDEATDQWEITNPYIVNGCQTTRTLFEVIDRRLGVGGTGTDTDRDAWEKQLCNSAVVVKVVTSDLDSEILNITRYTNTQSAVRDRDLVALDENFNRWKQETEELHGRYLEIQRGGWDSRKAFEKQHPDCIPRFTSVPGAIPIVANDMLKVFGAGWLGYAGSASRRSEDFLPGTDPNGKQGRVFDQIVNSPSFGGDDLVAAHHIFIWAKNAKFGARGTKIGRAQTRYLFYYTCVQLLRNVLSRGQMSRSVSTDTISKAILRLQETGGFDSLCEAAVGVIDGYFHEGEDAPYRTDPGFVESSLDAFIKSNRLDEVNLESKAPKYLDVLRQSIAAIDMTLPNQPSFASTLREQLSELIQD